MSELIRAAAPDEIEALIPILLEAEPSERALRWSLGHLSDTVYRLDLDGEPVAAATVRWRDDPSEIVELAVRPDRQRRGYGARLVAWIVAEARRRERSALMVGTGSTSIENILFYQKCGFRMDSIRRDYFWYHEPPIFEHGLRLRDMLVFRYALQEDAADAEPRR